LINRPQQIAKKAVEAVVAMIILPLLKDPITMNVVKMQRNLRHYSAVALASLCLNAAQAQSVTPATVAQTAPLQTEANSAVSVTKAPTLKEDPKFWAQRIKARAQARWQLIAEKKFAESHVYLSAASKSFLPVDQYSANIASANYADGSVGEVDCQEDACTAIVLAFALQRIPRIPQQIRTPLQIRERWIVEDGEAHLLQR
jgi:hypothetical protein